MNLSPDKIPNAITFIFDHGGIYTFFLDFIEGAETFRELTERFSNPLNWTGIWVSAGDDNLHFINLAKVKHFYFSVFPKEKFEEYKGKVFRNSEISKGVAIGILIPDDGTKRPPIKQRVKDIPKV